MTRQLPRHIFLVDDFHDALKTLCEVFEQESRAGAQAINAEEALGLLDGPRIFDVILTG